MQKGGLDVRARARELIKEKLEQYEPPSLPEDMPERLQAIINSSLAESQLME